MQPTRNARHVSVAAVTATAVTAVNAARALNAMKMALKPRFLLKIQHQTRFQANRYLRQQLLNL